VKLLIKFNLVLLVLFAIGLAAVGYHANNLTRENALQNVTNQAQILLEQAIAVRRYTVDEISPLLRRDQYDSDEFHAQSVPAYAATQVVNLFKQNRPEYNYKEAVFNPTNPRDNAAPWEENIIQKFIDDESLEKFVGKRIIDRVKTLYIAQPIKITNPKCLVCHSVPSAAPPAMIEKYGSKRGFGWKLGEIIGVQMITVPFTLPEKIADKTFKELLTSLSLVFAGLLLVINLLLIFFVVLPEKERARHAKRKRRA